MLSIRDHLADTWNYAAEADAREHLKAVMSWCARSRMKPFVKLARSLRSHMEGILGYYRNYTTSAAIEAINGLLQLARRRARGYLRFDNFRAIAYWIAGSLKSMAIQTQPTECSGEPILLTFANSRESC